MYGWGTTNYKLGTSDKKRVMSSFAKKKCRNATFISNATLQNNLKNKILSIFFEKVVSVQRLTP